MADLSSTLAQFSDLVGGSVTTLFSFLTNLATFFALATGLGALFFGRRLFWIFVATLGFIIGTHVAPILYPYLPAVMEPFEDLIGLGIALVLAGMAIVMQRFATIIFGALALGIVGYMIATSAGSEEWVVWVFAGLFGLAGGLLLYFFFDWTLVIVSVLVGSAIAIFAARTTGSVPGDYGLWLFALLLGAGLIYQGNDLRLSARARASASAQKDTAKQIGAPAAAAPKPTPVTPKAVPAMATYAPPPQPKAPASYPNVSFIPPGLTPVGSPTAQVSQPGYYQPAQVTMPAYVQPAQRVELFPSNPQSQPDAQPVAQPEMQPAQAQSFPPTFASSLPPQPSVPVASEPVAYQITYSGPSTTPDAMAPSLERQSSMSFSDLWKWTPWRKGDQSGTVSSNTTATDAPFVSSPEALG